MAMCGIYKVRAFNHNGVEYVGVQDLTPSHPLPDFDPVAELLEDGLSLEAAVMEKQMATAAREGLPAFWDIGFSTQPDDLNNLLYEAYQRAHDSPGGVAYTSDKGLPALLQAADARSDDELDEAKAFKALLELSGVGAEEAPEQGDFGFPFIPNFLRVSRQAF